MFQPAELVAALDAGNVRYIIIGGVAVAAHGYVRGTKDIDIVPDPHPANLNRLAGVLRELDAVVDGTGDFDPAEFPHDPRDPASLAEGGNFVLSTRLGRLDIMQWVPGIEHDVAFDHLAATAIASKIRGHDVLVCSRDDLVTMKRTAGRPQDLDDLRNLGDQ